MNDDGKILGTDILITIAVTLISPIGPVVAIFLTGIFISNKICHKIHGSHPKCENLKNSLAPLIITGLFFLPVLAPAWAIYTIALYVKQQLFSNRNRYSDRIPKRNSNTLFTKNNTTPSETNLESLQIPA